MTGPKSAAVRGAHGSYVPSVRVAICRSADPTAAKALTRVWRQRKKVVGKPSKTGKPAPKNLSNLYPLESEEQQTVFAWARMQERQCPELAWLTHVPNGGWRSATEAVRLKAEGVRAGFPDMILPAARRGYHALAIELKRRKGAPGRVSAEQRAWIGNLVSEGWYATVCHGADEAIGVIRWYLGGAELD